MLESSQADTLMDIERFVSQIVEAEQEQCNDHVADRHRKACNAMMDSMSQYLSVYHADYDYSEHLEAFWSACRAVGLLDNWQYQVLAHRGNWPSLDQARSIVNEIVRTVNDAKFRRGISDRRYQAKEKNSRIRSYAEALHKRHSRLLVVRVDWNYRKDDQRPIGIDDVYQHLDEMIQRITNRAGIFENLVGYAWCIEQGITRGYHMHTVFYFSGSMHQNDWYMAQQIGEQWVSVTEGLGTYHNCNTPAEKAKYEGLGMLGVGMIHRRDESSCTNAVKAVSYLADPEKEDQYLRMKPRGRRAFATGKLPEARYDGVK